MHVTLAMHGTPDIIPFPLPVYTLVSYWVFEIVLKKNNYEKLTHSSDRRNERDVSCKSIVKQAGGIVQVNKSCPGATSSKENTVGDRLTCRSNGRIDAIYTVRRNNTSCVRVHKLNLFT
ncbi:hypothetical protein PUN28_011655 [Cardiocondyla obscurior]|uniref:Uncharacterized protein n=1 Tax=Cardiocondyla obscurior TaxID=286306 RepID=A0AAW2FHE1_9HYME